MWGFLGGFFVVYFLFVFVNKAIFIFSSVYGCTVFFFNLRVRLDGYIFLWPESSPDGTRLLHGCQVAEGGCRGGTQGENLWKKYCAFTEQLTQRWMLKYWFTALLQTEIVSVMLILVPIY